MKRETYINLMDYLKERKGLLGVIKLLYTALPIVMVLVYPAIIIHNYFLGIDHKFILSIVVPAVTLLGSWTMRKLINKPRPYEKFQHPSLITKDKKGHSFPSNHSTCGFVIAMAGFSVSIYLGLGLIVIALLIALTRVFSGVHFISDVLAGSILGVMTGFVFIFI